MIKNIISQLASNEESDSNYWPHVVLRYDRVNNTARLHKPEYGGFDTSPHLLHPLITTYTELKNAFDKDKKDEEASNREDPGNVRDLVGNCPCVEFDDKIPSDQFDKILADIKDFLGFTEQRCLGEIGNFSYHWLGQYIDLPDWVDDDNRWDALEFEKLLTTYMRDFAQYYFDHGRKFDDEWQPKIRALWARSNAVEGIDFQINESLYISTPFLDPRGDGGECWRVNGFMLDAMVMRVLFQLPQQLRQYIDADEKLEVFIDGMIAGPYSNLRDHLDHQLIDIARDTSLDLASYLEQWSAFIEKHPDRFFDDWQQLASGFKRASENPSAVEAYR